MLTKILEYADDTLPKTCLDIGCGTGQLTRELYHRGYRCIGIDISDVAISLAKQNTVYHDALQYIQADVETISQLTLPETMYSLITCKLVYAFIKDKSHFLESVSDLLEERGSFVVITPINKDDTHSPIAVDLDETKMELAKFFSKITIFEGLNVTYFVCTK